MYSILCLDLINYLNYETMSGSSNLISILIHSRTASIFSIKLSFFYNKYNNIYSNKHKII